MKRIAAILLMVMSFSANSALITISTTDDRVSPGRDNQGWWNDGASNNNLNNDSYFAGAGSFRNYFTFSLAGLSGIVTSAELQVRRYNTDVGARYSLYDVSTSASDLALRGIIRDDIWLDLGSGTSYGSYTVGSGVSTDILTFTLNEAALADITSSLGGYFSLGGASSSGNLFGVSHDSSGTSFIQQIVLNIEPKSVPEPSVSALLGLGLLGMATRRKRMRK